MSSEVSALKPAAGRIENLTDEQERILKQVWASLLSFFGYKVGIMPPVSKNATSSTAAAVTPNVTRESSGKKKKGLMGKLRRHKKSKSIEKIEEDVERGVQKLERALTRRSSISSSHSTRTASTARTEATTANKPQTHAGLAGLEPKEVFTEFWRFLRHDTPDNLILRFVRARKWDTDKAMQMIGNTMRWRMNEGKPDQVLFDGELGAKEKGLEGVIFQLRSSKCIIRGHDKQMRPLVQVRPRFHHTSDQTKEEVEIFTLLMIEYARLMLTEPVDTCDVLFDLSGFTMSNMDYGSVSYMVKCFEAHYPESLGVLFIHKAPWIFSGIWKVVRKWLDPVVASKIVFTRSTADLEEKIDRAYILKELGGDDDFEYEYKEPTKEANGLLKVDDAKKAALQKERDELIEKFIQLTLDWIDATGDSSHKLLQQRIELGHKIAENYKELDGYIRNRGIYDRLGWIDFKVFTH